MLQIAFGAVASLLVVPVAVNVGTSGDAPPWLKPFINWLWPVAIVCVAVVIFLEFLSRRDGRPAGLISARHPEDARNAPRALAQISHYIQGRRKGALDEKVRLALALDERPETVRQTVHLVQRISGHEFQLSPGHGVTTVFDEMDGSLLILGAPGAGKTTLLLDLAAALAARADQSRIPVVVDLADWSRSGATRLSILRGGEAEPREFAEWLLVSLNKRYQIPIAVGRSWLATDRLILLLDGLDEVRESHRDRCVTEINKLQEEQQATRVVVCSREADYERLAGRLRLQGAVSIRPLTREQVMDYFDTVSPYFARTVEALHADDELWDLLTTPLMLNILALAQRDSPLSALPGEKSEPVVRRGRVFDAYLVEVLSRRRYDQVSSAERVLHALRNLANGSVVTSSGVRIVIPTESNADKLMSPAGSVCAIEIYVPFVWTVGAASVSVALAVCGQGLIAFVFGVALAALPLWGRFGSAWRSARIRSGWVFAVSLLALAILVGGVMYAGVAIMGRISSASPAWVAANLVAIGILSMALVLLVERDDWLWGLLCPGVAVVFAGLILTFGVSREALTMCGIGFAVMWVFGSVLITFSNISLPGTSARGNGPALVIALGCLAAGFVPPLMVAEYWSGSIIAAIAGFVAGLVMALVPSVLVGGVFVRSAAGLVLHVAGDLVPWRRRFLAFAVDRSILVEADGEYRFVHLLIRDHLAACDPDRLAVAVEKRRTALGLA
ncbi:NACHT domain-containing protein [Actinoplanes sp. CA-015351]|uniref:NACHT domain-containing protein n=1 Tax=Actinoplanes sp. CA-015351 TaxID=3239897 RepID=UPI003D96E155